MPIYLLAISYALSIRMCIDAWKRGGGKMVDSDNFSSAGRIRLFFCRQNKGFRKIRRRIFKPVQDLQAFYAF